MKNTVFLLIEVCPIIVSTEKYLQISPIPHALLTWPWHSSHELFGIYVPRLTFKQTFVIPLLEHGRCHYVTSKSWSTTMHFCLVPLRHLLLPSSCHAEKKSEQAHSRGPLLMWHIDVPENSSTEVLVNSQLHLPDMWRLFQIIPATSCWVQAFLAETLDKPSLLCPVQILHIENL